MKKVLVLAFIIARQTRTRVVQCRIDLHCHSSQDFLIDSFPLDLSSPTVFRVNPNQNKGADWRGGSVGACQYLHLDWSEYFFIKKQKQKHNFFF